MTKINPITMAASAVMSKNIAKMILATQEKIAELPWPTQQHREDAMLQIGCTSMIPGASNLSGFLSEIFKQPVGAEHAFLFMIATFRKLPQPNSTMEERLNWVKENYLKLVPDGSSTEGKDDADQTAARNEVH